MKHGCVEIMNVHATINGFQTEFIRRAVGLPAETAPDVGAAVARVVAHDPGARILSCGSLYLAGRVLRDNG